MFDRGGEAMSDVLLSFEKQLIVMGSVIFSILAGFIIGWKARGSHNIRQTNGGNK